MRETELHYCENEMTNGWYTIWCDNCGYLWEGKHHQECFCPMCGYAFLENWPKPKHCKDCYYCKLMEVKTLADRNPRIIKATCNNGETVDAENSWCANGVVNEEVFYDLLYGDSES